MCCSTSVGEKLLSVGRHRRNPACHLRASSGVWVSAASLGRSFAAHDVRRALGRGLPFDVGQTFDCSAWSFSRSRTMTSMADVPAFLLRGVPVLQPPHLEGLSDPSLSTEILPGPPSLLSVQQAAQKRDPKKPSALVSYLPTSDPGSTFSGLMTGAHNILEVDGPRRKRARVDKGYVPPSVHTAGTLSDSSPSRLNLSTYYPRTLPFCRSPVTLIQACERACSKSQC